MATESPERPRIVRFGTFEADLGTRELRKSGVRIKLHGQPFEVLAVLLERPGEAVLREELRQRLWSTDTFVDFDAGVNTAINRLREALGDSAENPRFIETVPRRGYRFIAPVQAEASAKATNAVPAPPQRLKRDTESNRHVRAASTSQFSKSFDSIAVLPLVNSAGDPETEYLSDGISESVINLLSQLSNLRVIPRTSAFRYKGREGDLKTVGRDLNVRTVLTGKLIRRGDRLVVQTELVDVGNDAQLWGGQFNRKFEDIFELQEELARQISENLRLRLTPEDEKRLAKRSTQNREAYQLLLKAQYHLNKWTPEGVRQGMAYARQAIEADPGCAEAYAWVSAAYSYLGPLGVVPPAEAFPKAKAAAQKALEIDDSLAEAHYVSGFVRLWYEWDWSGAEQACKRAIELNPNYAWGHALWSDWLIVMGRPEEGMSEGHLAVELDPLSANLNVFLGLKLCWRGDYDRALEQLQKALEFDPNFGDTHVTLALTYARKGTYEESLAECKKVASLFGSSPRSRAFSSLILAMAGKTDEAKEILSDLKKHPKLDPLSLIPLAETCSVLGEKTEAFEFLEAAYRERVSLLIFLDAYPNFKNIRSDPRYADLLRRMGLPQLRSPTFPS